MAIPIEKENHQTSDNLNPIERSDWIWSMITGIGLVIVGALAISIPVAFTFGAGFFLAALLIIGGIAQVFHAIKERKKSLSWLSLILGFLSVVAGIAMFIHPVMGLLAITLVVVAYLIIHGAFKIFYSFQLRPVTGWGLLLFSGIVSTILGLVLMFQLPLSALYVLGIFIGIDFLIHGASEISLSLVWRKIAKSETTPISIPEPAPA